MQRAHAADPGHPLALYNLGAHNLNRAREFPAGSEGAAGMIEAAIRYFSASLERDPERADCHRSLAVACSLLRYDARAAFHAAEAHRLDSRLEP